MKSGKKFHLADNAYPIVYAIIAIIIVAIIAVFVYKKRDKVEAQRTAKIIEINGPCTIVREGAIIDAAVDMPLYSGDTFYSGIDASARIMIDDDKFLYLDPATRINFTATGTPEETHTLIYVVSGSMLTEVKEKLADGESFDIVTPNTFMEIHGTKTLTAVVADENGNTRTSSAVLQGSVVHTTIAIVNGRIVSIPTNMPAGASNSVLTSPAALVGEANIRNIAATGKTVNGENPAASSCEASGISYDQCYFTNRFLTSVSRVLKQSEEEDKAAGNNTNDSDSNGTNDSIEVVNELMNNSIESEVGEAEEDGASFEETEEERLAREEKERLEKEEAERLEKEEEEKREKEEKERQEKEEADRLAQEEAERIAREEADRQAQEEEAARLAAEEEARLATEEEARLKEELAQQQLEQAIKETEERERVAREADEQARREQEERDAAAAQEDSDVSPADTLEVGDEDPVNHGTFTGQYSNTGFPVYEDSHGDGYYYLTSQDEAGIVWYSGELYDTPPSTT